MDDIKRMRPYLGTYVEISLKGKRSGLLEEAIERAYLEILAVERAMSFHDPKSELSILNRAPIGRWINVSEPLLEVLGFALQLQIETRGRFNIGIGRPLVAWKYLPGRACKFEPSSLRPVGFELSQGRARRILPVHLDLGGIAKGYAVDRATEALKSIIKRGSGCVNAGGDLRVFGPRSFPVSVRTGARGHRQVTQILVRQKAVATSTVIPEDGLSPYVNTCTARPSLSGRTAVVIAPTCMIADALTKVALLIPKPAAEKIAFRYGADMSVVS